MNLHGKDIKIFTANANPSVAADIARELGLPLGMSEVVPTVRSPFPSRRA